ncbi:hypothetical protein ACRTAI_002986 [Clostridium perfringens]
MAKGRVNFKDKIKEESKVKKEESFFTPTADILKKEEELQRKTYYLTPALIKALALMSARTGDDKSEIVRVALTKHIPDVYIKEAEELLKK